MTGAAELADWIAAELARELHLDPAAIDRQRPLEVLGIDSLTAATLTAGLEDRLGRALPESLLASNPTIAQLARTLADMAPASRTEAPSAGLSAAVPAEEARPESAAWTPAQQRLQRLARLAARGLTRQEVTGIDRIPAAGPVIVAINHLHILDALWVFSVLPRRTIFLVAAEFKDRPVVGRLLKAGRAIFVERGEGDLAAIRLGVAALRSGAAVGIAPEGRLSRTGGLIRGRPGVARLAAESGAPVLPVAFSGQEGAVRCWLRGRRVPIRVTVGTLIPPPEPGATARALEEYAGRVMRGLAEVLPPQYRGVYGTS